MPEGFTYDDFDVGQRFASAPVVVERARIISFAAEFDPQPQHRDEQTAANSHFGELVASGWHTGALSMRLFTDALPPIQGGGQGAELEGLNWPNPVRPGDALRIEIEVVDKRESRSRPDRGIVKLATRSLNQRDEVVQTVTHIAVMPRRDAR